MRHLITVLLCLVLTSITSYATNEERPNTESKKEIKKERTVLEVIPNANLEVEVSANGESLNVNLDGNTGKLDWIIFQPKGKVISRLMTTSKIDKIKIHNLTAGRYVLMVKDADGRVITTAFDKV